MDDSSLDSVSPLDGRYSIEAEALSAYFSEFALIRYRLKIEVDYLFFLHQKKLIAFSSRDRKRLTKIVSAFDHHEAQRIKEIEAVTHHDIKAIEYYLREQLGKDSKILPFIHLALTSEDINSIAYGLALSEARDEVMLPVLEKILLLLRDMANKEKATVMIARTHGQPAVPTTFGKELMVFALRIFQEYERLRTTTIEAKLSGAVGNWNSFVLLDKKNDWFIFTSDFISSYGLLVNLTTTQIIPADSYVRLFQNFSLLNSILISFSQDIWRYISDGYLSLKTEKDSVGSSTMPQKVNPIDFENAEGNLGLANALFSYFSEKLPLSRLQRDLSDSTVKRNFGSAFGYSFLAYRSLIRGLKKITVNKKTVEDDLNKHWEVLAEAVQTVLRVEGDEEAYEKLKKLSQGKMFTPETFHQIVSSLGLPPRVQKKLNALTPFSYVGLAEKIVDRGFRILKISKQHEE